MRIIMVYSHKPHIIDLMFLNNFSTIWQILQICKFCNINYDNKSKYLALNLENSVVQKVITHRKGVLSLNDQGSVPQRLFMCPMFLKVLQFYHGSQPAGHFGIFVPSDLWWPFAQGPPNSQLVKPIIFKQFISSPVMAFLLAARVQLVTSFITYSNPQTYPVPDLRQKGSNHCLILDRTLLNPEC